VGKGVQGGQPAGNSRRKLGSSNPSTISLPPNTNPRYSGLAQPLHLVQIILRSIASGKIFRSNMGRDKL
jgi:hypothetical protein